MPEKMELVQAEKKVRVRELEREGKRVGENGS